MSTIKIDKIKETDKTCYLYKDKNLNILKDITDGIGTINAVAAKQVFANAN